MLAKCHVFFCLSQVLTHMLSSCLVSAVNLLLTCQLRPQQSNLAAGYSFSDLDCELNRLLYIVKISIKSTFDSVDRLSIVESSS